MVTPIIDEAERKKILDKLNILHERSLKRISFRRYYHRNKRIAWLITLIAIFLIVLTALIMNNLIFFDISLIFSVIALITSSITFLTSIASYPVDNVEIKRLKEGEQYYEITFSITNVGLGRLKLNFAMYFVESITKDSELSSFLQCDTEDMSQYLNELMIRIQNDVIEPYPLFILTRDYHVFYTHNDTHTETRLHKLEPGKTYMITFLFQTSNRIYYYTSKFLKP
jgi:hypothetical protein